MLKENQANNAVAIIRNTSNEVSGIHMTRLGKIPRFQKHWKLGREFGYPICCIFRFSFEAALMDGKTYPLANYKKLGAARGAVWTSSDSGFVPCGIFHWRGVATKTSPIVKLLRKECMSMDPKPLFKLEVNSLGLLVIATGIVGMIAYKKFGTPRYPFGTGLKTEPTK